MKNSIALTAAVVAAFGACLIAAAPASAASAASNADEPFYVDCGKTAKDGIDAARATGWDICEKNSNQPILDKFGVSHLHVDRVSTGKGKIFWGVTTEREPMTERFLRLDWKGAGAGNEIDVSEMLSTEYSNEKTIEGSGELEANLEGHVLVGISDVFCSVNFRVSNKTKI